MKKLYIKIDKLVAYYWTDRGILSQLHWYQKITSTSQIW